MNGKALVIGGAVLALSLAGCKREERMVPMPAPSGQPQQVPGGGQLPGAAAGIPANPAEQQIMAAKRATEANPKDAAAWTTLGNAYFDTRQYQPAVEAYAKALELKPNDVNVITDQGVMYRELGQPDKAIENFEKAQKLDPTHPQSLFNLGIVHAFDLKQPEKGIAYWNKVIQQFPNSPDAQRAQQLIQQAKGAPAQQGAK